MIKIIIGIFLALITFLVGTLISGDIIVFFAWWLFPVYAFLLIIYFALYAVIGLITNKPLTAKVKVLLIIPTISIPLGYIEWSKYRDAKIAQENQIQRIHKLIEALNGLPANADVGEDQYRLYATTNNLKDEYGNQPTFKWGDFELTSFKSTSQYSVDDVEVISLTQPKELPIGIKCSHELGFTRKMQGLSPKGAVSEEFEFSKCKVDELSLMLNNRNIQLKEFMLYYNHGIPEYRYETKNLTEKIANLNALHHPYWVARPKGYVKIGDEWIADYISLIFNQEGKPIMLIGAAQHKDELDYTKINQCVIKPRKFTVILTELQDGQVILHTSKEFSDDFSESCPETVRTTLTYFPEQPDTLEKTKASEMKRNPILQIFTGLDDKINVTWSPEYQRLHSVIGMGKPFFWGDINITSFQNSLYKIQVNLADNATKLGAFSCREDSNAEFVHLPESADNTLAYNNFALAKCTEVDGLLWFENNPIQAGMGSLEYVDTSNKLQKKSISDTSLLIFTPRHHDKAILTVNGFPFYLKEALTNQQGEIITLVGKLMSLNKEETIKLGECEYDHSLLKLTHFSEKQVDISFNYLGREDILEDTNTQKCKFEQATYQILSQN